MLINFEVLYSLAGGVGCMDDALDDFPNAFFCEKLLLLSVTFFVWPRSSGPPLSPRETIGGVKIMKNYEIDQ